ncbi:MAG: FliM/FliN family flagellar motor switch protein [Hyphomonadaceae bacterium]
MSDKTQVHSVKVEISVVLGRAHLPMHQLLRMGRGAVIPLDTGEADQLWILANNHPIARGEITIDGERLCITVTEPANVHEFHAQAA